MHGHAASLPLLGLFCAARPGAGPAQPRKDNAAREAAFRIEPSRVSFSRPAPRASTPNAQPEPSARGRQAMAEIRESGKPFDCLALCAAIQRMLHQAENRQKLFAFSEKVHQNVA